MYMYVAFLLHVPQVCGLIIQIDDLRKGLASQMTWIQISAGTIYIHVCRSAPATE